MPRKSNPTRIKPQVGKSDAGESQARLLDILPGFDGSDVKNFARWTLSMTAAWFVWRSYEAVLDQLYYAREKIDWQEFFRRFGEPVFLRQRNRRPGSVACVFEEAGLAKGERPLLEISDYTPPSHLINNPYGRLKFALQQGLLPSSSFSFDPLKAQIVLEASIFRDDWINFDEYADPPKARWTDDRFPPGWSCPALDFDPTSCLILCDREKVISVERALCQTELRRPIWSMPQALGWLAYKDVDTFRSLTSLDLERRSFLMHRYRGDWVHEPLETLLSSLRTGRLRAHINSTALSETEIGDVIRHDLWKRDDIWVRPEDVKRLKQVIPAKKISQREDIIAIAVKLGADFVLKHPGTDRASILKYLSEELAPDILSLKAFKEHVLSELRNNGNLTIRGAGRPPKLPKR